MIETVPELQLETYVVAYKYFIKGTEVDQWLVLAVCAGLVSLSTGIANAYFCEEKFMTRFVVTCFFGFMCVARFSVHVALLLVLGQTALYLFAGFLCIRLLVVTLRYKAFFEENIGDVHYAFIFTVGWIDVFLTYFFTIGTDDNVQGRNDRNDRMSAILAMTGPLEKATVEDKLLSSNGLGLVFIHVVEILIGWGAVLSVGADAAHVNDITETFYFVLWCAGPLSLALLALLYTWASPHKGNRVSAAVQPTQETEGN